MSTVIGSNSGALGPRLLLGVLPALPTLCALVGTLVLFSLFLLVQGQPALDALGLIVQGAFGSSFAWQSTLLRAAPLMLTALCVALPAQVGLIVIGGEGALALGGLGAAIVPSIVPASLPWFVATPLMAVAGMLAGALWIGAIGAMRQWRGVNETISSLLMSYIAIALFKHLVEGPLRDPASLNKPSTPPVPDALMIGSLPGLDVHWGLLWGALACVAAWVFVRQSTKGFAMRVAGGNHHAARLVGLPVTRLALTACMLGGAAAGLAGMFEVAAVQGSANASLLAGYGYAGILVAFAARQNPLAIILCAVLVGGIEASGSLLQRRLGLPDATTLVLQGLLFANLLAWEALGGRITAWRVKLQAAALARSTVRLEGTHA
ncbi:MULTISPECIES: ABC transporter permease [unclassified Caballeronia]|uniref:ABC transporter permease n=1 Tax=unclassified Caballeronia TaxID=2646786 RepID=UPI001FD1BA8A|nr:MULTISPECIES: ABC transporter permease [unclassified Caballeronia]MDR5775912.1 ABC transporter permease [Caballeronia sp. LZ002]MDR5801949.1 ABC transporter permease [Caballeronia sp. LZ001]MDR5851351.1 ABC transporter permease [Caballeronia sp. LZ003]